MQKRKTKFIKSWLIFLPYFLHSYNLKVATLSGPVPYHHGMVHPKVAMLSGPAPCHHSMVHPQVADRGEGVQIRRVAANILNKQSRTADKGWQG
jgi:hypothetical protein